MTEERALHAETRQGPRCVEGPAPRSRALSAIRVPDDIDQRLATDDDQGSFTVESRLSRA